MPAGNHFGSIRRENMFHNDGNLKLNYILPQAIICGLSPDVLIPSAPWMPEKGTKIH